MNTKQTKAVSAQGVSIMIVDDHPIVRQGVRYIIDQQDGMYVCAEAEGLQTALRAAEQHNPQIALIDLALDEGSGLDLIKDMQVRHPEIKLLVLTMRDETFYAERALHAGAMGFINKNEGAKRLLDAIWKAMAGEVSLSPELSKQLLGRMVGGERPEDQQSAVAQLTDRELQVFELIGQGKTTRQIAEELHLSVKTIESHREHLKGKLGLANTTQLLSYAIQWSVIEQNG